MTKFSSGFKDRIIKLSNHPKAEKLCYLIAFLESSIFPIPPDVLIIPMLINNPKNVWKVSFYSTIYSVIGGILGYLIGYFLYDSVGKWLIEAYSYEDSFIKIQQGFDKYGMLLIMLKGLTPLPFKLVTLSSGFVKFNFVEFLIASIICRATRFYMLGGAIYFLGERFRNIIMNYIPSLIFITMTIIVLGYFLVKLIF